CPDWAAMGPSLSAHSVGREDDADDRAAVLPRVDAHASVERTRAFGELLVARAASLAGRVVGDHSLDAVRGLSDTNQDARRRPAPDRVVQRLADDLEDRDLSVLGQALRRVDVEVDLDAVRHTELLGKSADGRPEALVPAAA